MAHFVSPVHTPNQQDCVLDAGCGSGRVTAQLCVRPKGRLVAQYGGAGNIARVYAAASAAGVAIDPTHFASPGDTARRLRAAGFVEVRCWLHQEPTTLASRINFRQPSINTLAPRTGPRLRSTRARFASSSE